MGASAVPVDASLALQKKRALESSFFKKGVGLGLFSGITYGLYTAFITVAQNSGIWADWFGTIDPTSLLLIFILPTIAAALNDSCSAIWALIVTIKQGKFSDFVQTIGSKPGKFMILAALAGGPIANVAFIIGLSQAGPIVTPVSALCPAIGAILARILYKQEMGPRVVLGIVICMAASLMIGVTSLTGEVEPGMAVGLALALVAALGWGIEGCIAGFGTSMIDSQVGITIRQCTCGLSNLIIMVPILTLISGGSLGDTFAYVGNAIIDAPSIVFFVVSGFFAYISFSTWYKGNSMCGAALGMALNGTYTFFGPFFTWIVLGLVMGLEGYTLAPIAWAAAIVMMIGIFVIAMNPFDLFKKGDEAA